MTATDAIGGAALLDDIMRETRIAPGGPAFAAARRGVAPLASRTVRA